jgi:hypothetical protein
MDASTIREFVAQARPFQFKMSGGEVVRVPHLHWASLSPHGATKLVWKGKAPVTHADALIEKNQPLAETRRNTAT